MKISAHISYKEATKSNTAIRKEIENDPNIDEVKAMKNVAEKCFEPLRKVHGKPIGISSFFRSSELNIAIGGSDRSQHCKGEAIDIDADIFDDDNLDNDDIFHWLKDNVEFDQLIGEFQNDDGTFAWVHVSNKLTGENRGQILIAERINGKVKYSEYGS